MKILLVCNTDGALYVFRNPLIRALIEGGHEVVGICPDGPYRERLLAMGMRLHFIEFARHSISPLQNAGLIWQLWRIFRRERPDAVHSFTHKAVIYGALAARLAGIARIVGTVTGLGMLFVHDDWRSRFMRKMLMAQYRLAMSPRCKVLFQNPDDLQDMVSRGAVRQEQTFLAYGSGIDLEDYALPGPDEVARMRGILGSELGIDLVGRIVVLFPARGVPEKGFIAFYGAAKEVGKACHDRYVFMHLGLIDRASVGHLSARNVVEFAEEHAVHYLGFKDNIRDYMTAADIVALPSYYREGVPRSLIEALALGKVIVTTDVPGCRETVIEGENGFLCEPRSATSLAETLLKVDASLLARAVAVSRHYCKEKFDVKQLNMLTYSLYGMDDGR
jgi:N,N'-diacetylbacillosaminyl-diphospho-undecaprenol alpha-1,3-N-acetylgalactosaminyltransferase